MKQVDSQTAIIVGAGLSGICMGIALKEIGVDFIILEKTNEIGGTWSQNRYPGCGCDIPMFAYSYSFEMFQGDAWPKQPEILEYLKHCVKKYGISEHIRYLSSVNNASFDTSSQLWNIVLEDSKKLSTKFLINATGQLNVPNTPSIEGMDVFKNKMIHSANYPDNIDIKNKRVAIIGNGATALQIVEALQEDVKELLVFARSAKYIYPRVSYSPITINKMKENPEYWRQVRQQFIDSQDNYRTLLDDHPQFDPFDKQSNVKKFYAQSKSTDFGAFEQFYEWMIDKNMRPEYSTGCSRPLASNTFHEAIRAPNVNLIREPVQCFNECAVKTKSKEHEIDIVIFATGFSLNNLIPPFQITGNGGLSLSQAWNVAPKTYLGMATQGFPNLFFLYGPNTNTNASSVTFFVESQVNYIRQILEEYIETPFESIEIKQEVMEKYDQWLVNKKDLVSEASDCSSWYQNKNRINISTFPGNFREYESLTAEYVSSEYHIIKSSGNQKFADVHLDERLIKNQLVDLFSETTLLSTAEINPEGLLRDYPLDSILIVDFIKKINEHWNLTIDPSIFFEYSSLYELSRFLFSTLKQSSSQATSVSTKNSKRNESSATNQRLISKLSNEQIEVLRAQQKVKPKKTLSDEYIREHAKFSSEKPIAIIGAHGYFPRSSNLETFWDNLFHGRDCISEIPESRWDWRDYYGNAEDGDKTKVKWAGIVDGVDEFEPLFFNMSPKEAELMDPQHRLFIQCAWELFESAGYNPNALTGKRIGVILGVNLNDYAEIVADSLPAHDVLQMSGLMHLFGANRLSYLFGLTGPSEVIDTACSSSLIAIHRAVQSIHQDNCEMMLAGGSNLILTPKMHLLYSKAGMLSEDGRCKTFSAEANGYVRGEGVAGVLLKKLAAAKEDGDTILGIIKGSSENHGGKANSLTAPNPKLQAKLIEEAMLASKVDPRSIGYIECHGTGTALGDPIEINGIQKAYRNLYKYYGIQTPVQPHCGLGSVKSNIGHLETAAGIAGVIKVLLCFKKQYLPKTINCSPVNSQIHLDETPFYLVNENQPWRPVVIHGEVQPRRAGISSFGAGGSNAHLILEEYPETNNQDTPLTSGEPVIVPLSAGTNIQLMQRVTDLLAFIQKQSNRDGQDDHSQLGGINLEALGYTLQVARDAMDERLGFVVSSVKELAQKLSAFISGETNIDGCFQGQVYRNKETLLLFTSDDDLQETVNRWLVRKKVDKLLELWVKGLELDWEKLYHDKKPRRIGLPTYPFLKERHWIDANTNKLLSNNRSSKILLHPLVHSNTSDLSKQSYESTFDGGEFFLNDHRVNGQKILPAVAYLEMAREAVSLATPIEQEPFNIEIINTVWAKPLLVNERTSVRIDLLPNGGDKIEYEIYSLDDGQQIKHCQGQIAFSRHSASAQLEISKLKAQMTKEHFEASELYTAFDLLGLNYGSAHRALTNVYLGENQLLASLELPSKVKTSLTQYQLQPSMLDGALQACNGLISDLKDLPEQPSLPFALESIDSFSPCTGEMFAWVRFSPGINASSKLKKLDIDLCDNEGKVCVRIRGFSSRRFASVNMKKMQDQQQELLLASPEWKFTSHLESISKIDSNIAEHHIILYQLPQIDPQQLEASVRNRKTKTHCFSLQSQPGSIAENFDRCALACFDKIQSIIKSKPRGNVLLQVIIGNKENYSLSLGLSGMLKTAGLENPKVSGQIILTDSEISIQALIERIQLDKNSPQDSCVKYQDNKRTVLNWKEIPHQLSQSRSDLKDNCVFKENGVYLITGGLGGLGFLFSTEILKQAANVKIVFTGRSELTKHKQKRLAQLKGSKNQLTYLQMDLSDLEQVKSVIDYVQEKYQQLNGIFHCAGMISDNFILKKEVEEFNQVLSPKVTGTYNLDQASKHVNLDFLTMFSSVTASIGYVGQADYAAANGFMDQFAGYRNQLAKAGKRRGKTLSVNWPYWHAGGIQLEQNGVDMLFQATGMSPMKSAIGMQAFYQSVESKFDQIIVMAGDLTRLRQTLSSQHVFQAEAGPDKVSVETAEKNATSGDQLVFASKDVESKLPLENINSNTQTQGSLTGKTLDYLREQFSTQLKIPAHQIDVDAPLEKYGIDSILAMDLTKQLEKNFGTLSKTLFFEYQTISELVDYFVDSYADRLSQILKTENISQVVPIETTPVQMAPKNSQIRASFNHRFGNQSPASGGRFAADSASTQNESSIAIVGLSGRYPESADLEEYWQNLSEGKDCIIEIPKERWDWQDYYDRDRSKNGHHFSKWGGFISGVDEFDSRFFNISPREAITIDPQERLFLQHAWMAVEDAGYTRDSLQIAHQDDLAGQVGVYVGVMYSEYQLLGAEASIQGNRMGVASSVASISNRVSYFFNLHGPSMTLDTMCSSSFTAIHLACQDLKLGRTSLAIAGGVNVTIHPNKYLMLSSGQFISSDGHCQSFGEGGDGYIPGEGVGVVVLKRISEAEQDGNQIYGIIRGSAINHGGKTNGYTVPNPQAQSSAISRVLMESNTDPRHISFIEAHGTGTKLGDPIEIAALSKAFGKNTQDKQFCLIGSSKSNIGHCESAAGIAGLTKVLLQMKHEQIVPSLHSEKLNPHIDFTNTPFSVNQILRKWEQPIVDGKQISRIAGISSFGAGGSNAHIILEEYISPTDGLHNQPLSEKNNPVIILLSARTEEQLLQKAGDLLHYIKITKKASQIKDINLKAISYTLQIGREAMDERLGFVVDTTEQLIEKLKAYVSSEKNVKDIYRGRTKDHVESMSLISQDEDMAEAIDKWFARKKLSKLLDLWVKGLALDWKKLYRDEFGNTLKFRFVSLPTYPFAKKRFWIDTKFSQNATTGNDYSEYPVSVIHPLLHINTSNLNQQSYSSKFNGDEVFLKSVASTDGKKITKYFPAIAQLEMIRAAIEHASGSGRDAGILELHNIFWGELAIVTEDNQISIALFPGKNSQVGYEIYSTPVVQNEHQQEEIHCQGNAHFSSQPSPEKLDISNIKLQMTSGKEVFNRDENNTQEATIMYKGSDQLLAEFSFTGLEEKNTQEYVLYPNVMNSIQLAITNLNSEWDGQDIHQPITIESLRIIFSCSSKMFIWVRRAPKAHFDDLSRFDIDLADTEGNVCLQIRGLNYQRFSQNASQDTRGRGSQLNTIAHPVLNSSDANGSPEKRVSLETRIEQNVTSNFSFIRPQSKPDRILLASLDQTAINENDSFSSVKPLVKLVSITSETIAILIDEDSPIELFDCGRGVFKLYIRSENDKNVLSVKLIEHLIKALKKAEQEESLKVLLLYGTELDFLHGDREHYNIAVEKKLYQLIASFPYPVISVMLGSASGSGFLVGAISDYMICSEESSYRVTEPNKGYYPDLAELDLFEVRFGKVLASNFLYFSDESKGALLHAKGWSCPIPLQAEIETNVDRLVASLVTKSQVSLSLLKQHLARDIISKVDKLEVVALDSEVLSSSKEKKASNVLTFPSTVNLQLKVHADKVLAIRINNKKNNSLKKLLVELGATILRANETSQYSCVVISSEYPDFLPSLKQKNLGKSISNFQRLMLGSSLPIIFALEKNTNGLAWYLSQFGEQSVYSEEGIYSVEDIWRVKESEEINLVSNAAIMFEYGLGDSLAKEIIITGRNYTGSALKKRLLALEVVKMDQVLFRALELAENLGHWPGNNLFAWKKYRNLNIQKALNELSVSPTKPVHKTMQGTIDSPKAIALTSKVISATHLPDDILVIKMVDREAKNMFSEAIIEGLHEIFDHIEQMAIYKAVILTGYEHYFSSGGTKEVLLSIQQGKAKFTDWKIFQLAIECKVPVIAAMQGHGIGAGWSMGMFADFVLFSEESHYVSPYMNYGFTPGAGSTYIFPRKIGYDLARDTLLGAQQHAGSELKRKGLSLPVLSRKKTESSAIELAKAIAKRSRASLIALKKQYVQPVVGLLKDTYQQELMMHEKTFVGSENTLTQIIDNFSQLEYVKSVDKEKDNSQTQLNENVGPTVGSQNQTADLNNTEATSHDRSDDLSLITKNMKLLLAQELHMEPDEIEEDAQFIDLGLDSITGVTWIRKVNENYQISIEATKVYSYPTLAELSLYVKDEATKQGVLLAETESPGELDDTSEILSDSNDANRIVSEETGQILAKPKTADKIQSDGANILVSITQKLKELLAEELHMDTSEVDDDAQFIDLGLDSITGVTWIRKINEEFQTVIEATKVYSYPTLSEISNYVKDEAQKSGVIPSFSGNEPAVISTVHEKPAPKKVAHKNEIFHKEKIQSSKLTSWRKSASTGFRDERASTSSFTPIAIIGMAGQFPQANNINEYWKNIAESKNCITQISQKRWDIEQYYQASDKPVEGKTYSQWMGALEEYDLFDPLFFNISPIEAESMDPQQRLFLQTCWGGIEDAGYNSRSLSGTKCGVFVGCGTGDYQQFSRSQQLSAQGFTGGATSILAARISYLLNFQGPCLSIDTACSSSLVAIASACDSLNSTASDIALAGGVFVMSTAAMHIKTSQSGMLSKDGRCFTFDQRANGFVPGEGVGVVVLKRLSDAENHRDQIYGVIQGWGVNQDGKTNGITAPNAKSQTRLQQDIYDKFQINPAEIQLIEAHGTGTKLGDPIEVEGLKDTFSKYTDKTEYCALGSVKSNIGHCIAAAGISGIIKILLALKHKQLPPTINFEELNEHIGLKNSPFYINNQLQSWEVESGKKRQAAISSFGFSGTNAHMVISEHVTPLEVKHPISVIREDGNVLIPISAKNSEQLDQKVSELLNFISTRKQIDLVELAYTLQIGRDAMEERLGILASSLKQLTEKLQMYVRSGDETDGILKGRLESNKKDIDIINQDSEMKETIVSNWIANNKLSKILGLWVKGLEFDWNELYGDVKPQRISLPAYPFAKERYWIESSGAQEKTLSEEAFTKINHSMLHPLLHTNTSDFSQQSYLTQFSGDEFFLKDHQVRTYEKSNEKILPGVAYLEMVRAAIANASSTNSNLLKLHNVVWVQPVVVSEPKAVSVVLFENEVQGEFSQLIDFVVTSKNDDREEIVHCQGQASFVQSFDQPKLDIERIKTQMKQSQLMSSEIYNAFSIMGLVYGPAHQGIKAIHLGNNQLVGFLQLPESLGTTNDDYILHPSMMDSALQTTVGLTTDFDQIPNKPSLPFSIGSLRVLSACTNEMFVFARYSSDSGPQNKIAKFDMDLCDLQGNICVQIQDFSLRTLGSEIENTLRETINETYTKESHIMNELENFDDGFYEDLIESVLSKEISVDEAVELEE